jgi:hypothetical protein
MIDKQKEKPKNEHDISQVVLMLAIGFTEEDLAANRDNVLSPTQITNLARQQRALPWLHVLGAVIACLFAGILLLSDLASRKIGIGVIFTLSVVFAFAPSLWDWYTLIHNIKVDRVIGIQGHVRLDLDDKNQYFLQLTEHRFEVNKNTFLAFKNGDPYAIYYAPRNRIILSAEWLRPE